MILWKSGYTEIIHEFEAPAGFWAYVKCQRASIPGCIIEASKDGRFCTRCFPPGRLDGENTTEHDSQGE